MTALAISGALSMALACSLQAKAQPAAVDRHSVDLGLMQINSANLADLHLTLTDAFGPCHSLTAGARVLVGRYVAPMTLTLARLRSQAVVRGLFERGSWKIPNAIGGWLPPSISAVLE